MRKFFAVWFVFFGGSFAMGESSPVDLDIFGAASTGNKAVINKYIASGLDVDVADASGLSILHFASKHGQKEIVELLLNVNANMDTVDLLGLSPIHFAWANGHKDIMNLFLLRKVKVTQDLLEKGLLSLERISEELKLEAKQQSIRSQRIKNIAIGVYGVSCVALVAGFEYSDYFRSKRVSKDTFEDEIIEAMDTDAGFVPDDVDPVFLTDSDLVQVH